VKCSASARAICVLGSTDSLRWAGGSPQLWLPGAQHARGSFDRTMHFVIQLFPEILARNPQSQGAFCFLGLFREGKAGAQAGPRNPELVLEGSCHPVVGPRQWRAT